MKDHLKKVFEIIDHYIDKPSKVVEYKSPKDLRGIIHSEIGKEGEDFEALLIHISNYLKYSVNTGDKQFFNQLYAGFNFPAFVGDVITSLSNTSMYTYEVAPVATILEIELIQKMNQITGFHNGDGLFVSGGSNANLMAMFSARNKMLPEIKQNGIYQSKPLVAFVSDQAHYSFGTAANVLGIGTDNLVKIKSDEKGMMIPEELERQIVKCLEKENIPFFVTATTGTTLLGAFDPINKIANITEKYKLWLHIDGSFGGSIILSPQHKHLFMGIEKADSFTWNPHKLMNIPLICSVILMKDKGALHNNLFDLNTDYIFHENETQHYDLGKKSIQCGRRVDSLKLWLAWKYYGDNGYEERINKLFEIAEYFAQKVTENNKLELLAPVQSLTVCFRYINPIGWDANKFNERLRENLRLKGNSIINYGFLGKELVLRFVIVNPEVEKKDIDLFIDHLIEEGDLLSRQ